MPLGTASGQPQFSGVFIPEIWSGKLVEKFYDSTVLTSISNTDYEGEIKNHGDTVHIRTVPDTEIFDYVKGQALELQTPNAPKLQLDIDRGKYFAFICDDIDRMQADIDMMNKWSEDASMKQKIKVDQDVLGAIVGQAHERNRGAGAGAVSGSTDLGSSAKPVNVTESNVIQMIIQAGLVLDEQNVPETGRFLVLPAKMAAMIKLSELRDASISGDGESIMRNGRLGVIDTFTLYKSHNVHRTEKGADTKYHPIAGHKSGLTFASQMTQTEDLKAERTFGRIVRGLQVYGFKVVKPESLVEMVVTLKDGFKDRP